MGKMGFDIFREVQLKSHFLWWLIINDLGRFNRIHSTSQTAVDPVMFCLCQDNLDKLRILAGYENHSHRQFNKHGGPVLLSARCQFFLFWRI